MQKAHAQCISSEGRNCTCTGYSCSKRKSRCRWLLEEMQPRTSNGWTGPLDSVQFIWKILGCCGNAKGHCRNASCNSSIAAMMQQREHCGNALQYCGNTCCGNVEGHCKQHQHCGNIAAIRALKRVLRQCAEALQQYVHCRNTQRHCSNTGIAAMR